MFHTKRGIFQHTTRVGHRYYMPSLEVLDLVLRVSVPSPLISCQISPPLVRLIPLRLRTPTSWAASLNLKAKPSSSTFRNAPAAVKRWNSQDGSGEPFRERRKTLRARRRQDGALAVCGKRVLDSLKCLKIGTLYVEPDLCTAPDGWRTG